MTAPALQAKPLAIQLKNGDTIHAEPVPEESDDTITVVIHPQLGRLEINNTSIQPTPDPPAWSSSLAAGMVGVTENDGNSVTVNLNASSTYSRHADKIALKAETNYNQIKNKGEAIDVKTDKGSASIRYDRKLNETLNLFSSGSYDYNGLNDASINTVKASIGAGFPIMQSETTELVLSAGPTLQWSGGGHECASNAFCGNTYPGGAFTTQLNWTPNRSFKINLDNALAILAANTEVKPTNTFTATIKYFPSFNSGLFTSIQFKSIYNSIAVPQTSNTLSGQVGLEF